MSETLVNPSQVKGLEQALSEIATLKKQVKTLETNLTTAEKKLAELDKMTLDKRAIEELVKTGLREIRRNG